MKIFSFVFFLFLVQFSFASYDSLYDQILNDPDKGLIIAKDKLKDAKNSTERFNLLTRIAIACDLLGNIKEAKSYFIEAESYIDKTEDQIDKGIFHINYGIFYFYRKDFPEAELQYKMASEIFLKIGDFREVISCKHNLATLYKKQNKCDLALEKLDECLEIHDFLEDKFQILGTLRTQFTILYECNKTEGLVDIARRTVDLFNDLEDTSYVSPYQSYKTEVYSNLGLAYSLDPVYFSLIPPIIDSLLKDPNQNVYTKLYVYSASKMIYENTGNYKKALELYTKYTNLNDSVNGIKNQNYISDLELKYQTKKKDLIISKQENETNKLEQQNIIMFLISMVVVVIAFFVVYALKKKRKENQLLSEKTEIIHSKLEQREFLMREIHHRVKNNLQMIIGILQIQKTQERFIGLENEIDQTQKRILTIGTLHEQLYQKELEKVNIEIYLKELVDNISEIASAKQSMHIQLDIDDVDIEIDYAIHLGLLLNELITNSIKHVKSEDIIAISFELKREQTGYFISYKDNNKSKIQNEGKGFGSNLIMMLLKKFSTDVSIDEYLNLQFYWNNK